MVTVYALSLEDGKYYVGKTNDVERRFSDHVNGNIRSAHWTRKYKPIKIAETFEGSDSLDEDKITLMYMIKYGIDHVRGGPYVSGNLSAAVRDHIRHRIRMACDLCGACGSDAHFIRDCKVVRKTRAKRAASEQHDSHYSCDRCFSPHHFPEDCVSHAVLKMKSSSE